MSWVAALGGLCALIVLHETGHYLAARATGMRVEKFFLFFGPKLLSVKRGETEYGIGTIPLGGYAKISGMNPEEELPPDVAARAYCRQAVWKRIVVIGAGPAVNIGLAIAILFAIALTSAATPTSTVAEVEPSAPAAGSLKPGDKILAIDGRRYPKLSAEDRVERFREEIDTHKCAGEQVNGCRATTPVHLTIKRAGDTKTIAVVPEYDAAAQRSLIGFSFDSKPTDISVGEAARRAISFSWFIAHETVTRIAKIFDSKERKEIGGIVGASDVAHQTAEIGVERFLLMLALISLSLGLINLFPFLPLDGGHIFWSLVEKVRGKPASLAVMERASFIGIALVAVLFFIGLSNDIGRITGEGFNVR